MASRNSLFHGLLDLNSRSVLSGRGYNVGQRVKQGLHSRLIQRRRLHNVQSDKPPFRIAIVGSGPAGFYAAARLIERNEQAVVDMYEQLPVPFGLVRFGVAPDHPEVKNCQDRFTEVAESPRFNFIGNVSLGHQLPLRILQRHYDAILFAYGASKDRELGLPGERATKHIYSARAFVGWYNGLPEYRDLNPDLTSGEDAVVIGQGNVALDVARVLLTDVDVLRKTDMTDYALEALSSSKIKNVRIVGRRGPAQAAFTIKELRELMQLPLLNKTNTSAIPADISSLPRPTKRLLQLLQRGQISEIPEGVSEPKSWSLDFLLSPHSLHWSPFSPYPLTHVKFTKNHLKDPLSPNSGLVPLAEGEKPTYINLKCSTLFRSIGYKSEPIPGSEDLGIPFDERRGVIPNDPAGRVLGQAEGEGDAAPLPGLYAAGWVKRGPTGVIASTMSDAFTTAEAIAEDRASGKKGLNAEGSVDGWVGVQKEAESEGIHLRPVTWEDWKKIDQAEQEKGQQKGKPREKFGRIEEMLELVS